ncbi:MAG TPA: ABC transporter ATP-binding protein [Cellulomonas sp.]
MTAHPLAAPEAGPAAALTFHGVGKQFADGTQALDGIDLAVPAGQIVSIVGPSGCGKSTLLRIVAGLTSASAGTVQTTGGRLGFVFQDPTLLPWRTVQGNLELAGRLDGLGRTERRSRTAAAIALTGLTGFERHLPRQLSGGMRMRVSLARELTSRPALFLLDEPFGALDELTRQRLDDELLRLHAAERFAALFVTHNVAEAVYVSHRVLVMSARPGRLVADVPIPLAHPRTPEDRFAPQFVAATHEVTARLQEGS